MNKNYLKELKDIQNIANKIRTMSINENINFEDEQEFDELAAQDAEEQPVPEIDAQPETGEECANGECDLAKIEKDENPEEQGMKELDQMGEVDQIRRITLDGMRKLADHPEHPQFQALLKIFQICNKAVEKDENEENTQKI